ncbi:MAG: pyridoxal phosphate-dependent aminotransferase [Acidobacteria bacterium]|nr:pyridoxal phosphate-dependent aminotransferase [Acidobacteriota bacterium]
MFSRRIAWSLEQNEYSRLLAQRRAAGAMILDLTESNPTRAGFAYPHEILTAFHDPRALTYEPAPWGLLAARQAVAREHQVDVSRVMLTASTSESYGYLFKLLCNPGDLVLAPRPSYPLFDFLAKLESVDIAQYSLRYDGVWHIDFATLEQQITPRTRAILLVNPNNPTGSYVTSREVERLAVICVQHGLALVSDEVFFGYPFGAMPSMDWSPVAERSLVFQLNGLSKMAGLPQMKAGWIIMDGPESLRAEAAERLELIADTFLSVSTPVQHALAAMLRHGTTVREQIQQRTRDNLAWLSTVAHPMHTQAGWYAILRLPHGLDDQQFVLDLLREDGVLVQPGFFYDFEHDGYVVLSLLTRPEDFRQGVERLLARSSSIS